MARTTPVTILPTSASISRTTASTSTTLQLWQSHQAECWAALFQKVCWARKQRGWVDRNIPRVNVQSKCTFRRRRWDGSRSGKKCIQEAQRRFAGVCSTKRRRRGQFDAMLVIHAGTTAIWTITVVLRNMFRTSVLDTTRAIAIVATGATRASDSIDTADRWYRREKWWRR
ncbi:hypothetical protein PHLCEN_2v12965 [Hermanssonia centrifuga]|uniref:Uncharacterized protein n=1 Tax=Hermanssonia centrifuga TaxID=98765 RepID=A0A2R6NFR4_9APHY|nr:hypothetical protein PHLCEN_2v12965 [Hermanssonia centrifuga]